MYLYASFYPSLGPFYNRGITHMHIIMFVL